MRFLTLLIMFMLISNPIYAQTYTSSPLPVMEEEDGDPSAMALRIKVTNSTLTDNGDGTVSLDNSGTSTTGWTRTGTNVRLTNVGDNVGIGTAIPQQKLDVEGGVYIDGGIYAKGNVGLNTTNPLYKLDVNGTANFRDTVTGISLSEIENLTANKTFTMAANDLTFNFTTPSNGFTLNATGAFSDHVLHVHQTTGNPGATQLVHLEADDADVLPLGIYHTGTPTNGYLQIGAADGDGGTKFKIASNGNVGIGATVPLGKLDVEGNVYFGSGNIGIGTSAPAAKLTIRQSSDSNSAGILVANAANTASVRFYSLGDLGRLDCGATAQCGVVLNGAGVGNVGVGTTAPAGLFDVNRKFTVLSGGNVGIGSTVPQERLDIGAGNYIAGEVKHLRWTTLDVDGLYGTTTTIPVIPKLDRPITITNLEVSCDANPATEPTGDIKYADACIGYANPVVINAFDTTNGVLSDSSITSGAVAAGKCVYVAFDTTPDADIKYMSFDVSYYYR